MGRAPCCDKANVKKGPWSPEEDAKLKAYIEQQGTGGNWIALPQKIGLKRCGKSCRLRWLNYLRPNIKHGGFSEEEDNIICSLYISIGSRWSIIAAQLPGRTDNDIKNYWNTRLKKKLLGKQRREQTQARRANNNLIKQEMMMKRETESSFHVLPGFLMSQTPPYWQEDQLPHVSLSPVAANPNYYNPPQLIKDEDQAASIKNLLIKLGGRFSDIQTQTKTTSTTDFDYPMVDISCAPQDQVFAHHDQQLGRAQYDADGCAGSTMFQGLENLQAELSELIYSNPAPQIDGSQSFYGIHNMDVINGGGGSSCSTSTSTGGADGGNWGEMNNSFVYPPMVSDFIKTYQ